MYCTALAHRAFFYSTAGSLARLPARTSIALSSEALTRSSRPQLSTRQAGPQASFIARSSHPTSAIACLRPAVERLRLEGHESLIDVSGLFDESGYPALYFHLQIPRVTFF